MLYKISCFSIALNHNITTEKVNIHKGRTTGNKSFFVFYLHSALCFDKDCIEDLRVYPTLGSQAYIDNAFSIRPRSAELLHVEVNVDEIAFNRNYYTVDVKYFYKVRGDAFPGCNEVVGLAVFDKRVMLYGSEGGAKTFSSDDISCMCPKLCANQQGNLNLPIATVEAVDPIALNMKIVDPGSCHLTDAELREIPMAICTAFNEELCLNSGARRLYATLGQFSIVRLERDVQILIPSYDYCMPEKECVGGTEEDPCTLFSKIPFPVEEFFPPKGSVDADDPDFCK